MIAPVWEADPELWFRDIRVNMYGSFLVCHALVKDLVDKKVGYVINMVSSGGVSNPHPSMSSYASSKTGLTRLTEGLARELESYNVKVFAIGPPAILTDMTKFILNDQGGKKHRPNFKEIFEKGEDYPPELISTLIINLVSGKADRLSGRYFLAPRDFDETVSQTDTIVERDLLTLHIGY